MASYIIKQDGDDNCEKADQATAVAYAVAQIGTLGEAEVSTFTVENLSGYLLAVVTNRCITGELNKQSWGGRNNNDALFVGREEFDATAAILTMPYTELQKLQDHDDSSDDIARSHIDWPGPCYVNIVDSVLAYFGVNSIEEITFEAHEFARVRANVQPATEEVLNLAITVRVSVKPGANINDFVKNLDYSVVSKTPGIRVMTLGMN